MNTRFTNQVALIAGGTGALGRAVTMAFVDEGAQVIVTYRDAGELAEVKRAAGANAASIHAQQVDVTDINALESFVAGIAAEHDRLDFLVNAVGAYAGGVTLWQTAPKVFEQQLALNLRSGF